MILSLLSMAIILCFQTKLHDGVCQKRQAATIATLILSLLSMATILCFQTKLHECVYQKRQVASIATHDLKSVKYGYYFVFSDKVTRWCMSEETGGYYSHP